MGSGGGGSTETQTDPWGPQGEQLEYLYSQARDLYDQGPLEYPSFGTVADRNPFSSQATANVAGLVQGGGLDEALAQNQATLRGDFLSPDTNPNLRQVGQSAAEDITRSYNRSVLPAIGSRFAGAGRSAGPNTGPGGHAEMNAISNSQRDLGGELSQMFAGLYGGAYETERTRMVGAQETSIGLRERQFADQTSLAAAGRDEFAYAQLQLNDMVQGFNFNQYAPYEQLGFFKDFISGGSYGGSSVTTATPGAMQYTGLGLGLAGAAGGLLGG